MTSGTDSASRAVLSPDEAFSVLGNDTRVRILQTLSETDGPLSFTDLRNEVGLSQGRQFNYHLEKLLGHFVEKTDEGYELRQAGRRVIEAVLSGAVTEAVVLEPTRVDSPCPYCGADIEVSYRGERLLIRCTECTGTFADAESTSGAFGTLPHGTLTLIYLPSAGLQDRSPEALLDAALAWTYIELVAVADGICRRCAGSVDHSIVVCQDHESDEGVCDSCESRFAVIVASRCSTCNNLFQGTIKHHLLGNPEVRSFFESRGVDVLAPSWRDMTVLYTYDEEVLGTDPFEGRFTFAVDDETVEVTVDDGLNVMSVTEKPASDAS